MQGKEKKGSDRDENVNAALPLLEQAAAAEKAKVTAEEEEVGRRRRLLAIVYINE